MKIAPEGIGYESVVGCRVTVRGARFFGHDGREITRGDWTFASPHMENSQGRKAAAFAEDFDHAVCSQDEQEVGRCRAVGRLFAAGETGVLKLDKTRAVRIAG